LRKENLCLKNSHKKICIKCYPNWITFYTFALSKQLNKDKHE
jgi:hypothetical protein